MLKLKPFRETPGFCGPASLKMVLEYFGLNKTEKELAKLTDTNPKNGTSLAGIIKAARRVGFKASHKDLSQFTDIQKLLNKKIPVIIDWFHEDCGHYSVAVGLDAKNIYLMDPELAAIRKIDRVTFKRIWFDFPGDFIKSKNDIVIRRMIVIEPTK